MIRRGDVVIVEFPYVDGGRGKNRPAVVVQADDFNARQTHTIIAMISGNTHWAGRIATHVLVDPQTATGKSSGLHGESVVKCGNLFTALQEDVLAVVGRMSEELMTKINAGIKAALALE